MCNNTPATSREYLLDHGETIVSTTDLQGTINYADPHFIPVSGFSEEELIGAPQNILRHPDMPAQAFADLWATIKGGRSWTGMVKNRCKNGDFYWLLANVTPVMEDGHPVGYMSVRTKPSRQQVNDAAKLYQAIKDGNAGRIAISQGEPVNTGVFAILSALKNISLGQRIGWNLGLLVGVLVALTANLALGATGPGHTWLTVLAAGAIVSALYFWHSLYGCLILPLKQALKASQVMGGGDLTMEIQTGRRDDIGQLLRSLRQLRVNLHSIVGDVRSHFEQIATAPTEIAAGNMDLSIRTESQASALEETTSSMEELASTVQQNNGNAMQANEMASKASMVAGKGGEIVLQVVATLLIDVSVQKVETGMVQAEHAAAAASLHDQTRIVVQILTVVKLDRQHVAASNAASPSMAGAFKETSQSSENKSALFALARRSGQLAVRNRTNYAIFTSIVNAKRTLSRQIAAIWPAISTTVPAVTRNGASP